MTQCPLCGQRKSVVNYRATPDDHRYCLACGARFDAVTEEVLNEG